MATSIKLKRKLYTRWDETDNIKRMKDSDILAEKEKPTTNYGGIAAGAATGAVAAGAAGATIGAAKGLIKPAAGAGRLASMGKFAGKYGKVGLLAGGALAAAAAYNKGKKQAEENQFYNQRLQYAKRQALRREKKDWKTNMTQRDGYSY